MIASFTFVLMIAVSAGAPTPEPLLAVRRGSAPELGDASQVSVNLCTELKAGWQLNGGESMFSPLGGFRLTMQGDGNLVLYAIDDMKLPADTLRVMSGTPDVLKLYTKPIWSTGTHVPEKRKSRGSYCVMEEDGNFAVYDQDHHPVFETATRGHPGSFLRLQSDGNLVVLTHDMKPTWASRTAARLDGEAAIGIQQLRPGRAVHAKHGLPAQLSMDLRPRWRLNPGDSLYSPLGGFRLILHEDGNLVLYHIEDDRIPADVAPLLLHTEVSPDLYIHPLWSTGTNVPTQTAGTGAYCVMNDDGNFVVYDEDDKPCFQSRTKGHPGAFLRCQDDGNLVVYTQDKKAIWQSKTYSRFVEK
jgi:hypothetical protein